MITLPSYPRPHVVITRGVRGLPTAMLAGLGDTCYDTLGDPYDCDSSGDPTTGVTVTVPPTPPITPITPIDTTLCDSAFCGMTASQQATFESLPAAQQSAYLQSAGIPASQWAQIIAAAGTAATNITRAATGQPAAVTPGTVVPGYTYNPATGAYTANASVSATASPMFIVGILAVAAFAWLMFKR
jgi:hypothetical protein